MEVKYEDLKTGYILKGGDTLTIYELGHSVIEGCHSNWLNCLEPGDNAKIFEKLGLTPDQKNSWADEFGGHTGGICGGSFPEFNTLEHLTAFVIDLFEQKYMPGHKSSEETSSPLIIKDFIKSLKKKSIAIKL